MKKLLILICLANFFFACSNDKDDPMPTPDPTPDPVPVLTPAQLLEGTYQTDLLAVKDTVNKTSEQTLAFSLVGTNRVKLTTSTLNLGSDIANFGAITVDSIPVTENAGSLNMKVENKVINKNLTIKKLTGEVKDKAISLQMLTDWKGTEITLNFSGNLTKNSQAIIYGITFNSDVIITQPELDGKNFTFYVKANATDEQLQLQPIYNLAKGAKVNPEIGETINFAEAVNKGKGVTINVASQDLSKTVAYTLTCMKVVDVNTSLENWVKGVEGQKPEMTYYEVANGWSSSNTGAHFLKSFSAMGIFNDSANINYNMVKVEDAQDGKYAAKIVTLNTTLNEKGATFGSMIPGITAGTLFTGIFQTDITNTLKSTKFGVPYFQKPGRFQGYYKYTRGKDYYVTQETEEGKTVTIDPAQQDAPALNAILYEVSSYKQNSGGVYEEVLTGLDLFTSAKVVARAEVKNPGPQANYTAFDVQFEYKKTYDPKKLYMLAIVFSSSKDGDKFCGAPGSTLIVDNIKVINE